MISKAQVKEIRALATSKARAELQTFLVEGDKLCREWLERSEALPQIFAVPEWLERNQALLGKHPEANVFEATLEELKKIATQQHPNAAVLVAKFPILSVQLPTNEWCLALDRIQDPGNMGTIIRIADWFGVEHIVCSPGCVDVYNPKVVAAGMGGHLRVKMHHSPLPDFLKKCKMPVYAATLHGKTINQIEPQKAAVLIIGNESLGIQPELLSWVSEQVTIPKRGGAESLNAAVATGILLSMLVSG
ncbi:MAG: RNA methyltransferase [Chitinophagaceae bacterium]